eukprot:TRINITY_DN325_c0_g1_i3.p1 TRINITY_DN325_c0_g1~~TRINITY_DN325_c0_g1_i3.p1  ORF type:complete len:577 (+),score=119.98 TRINITY_DN325_c0_g1_i3:87-1817(+)
MVVCALILILCVSHITSLSLRVPSCVHQKNCLDHDFELTERAEPSSPINLTFAVKHKNVDKLYELVNDVSNPKSPNYGKHWTFEKIGELTSDLQAQNALLTHLRKFVPEKQLTWSPHSGYVRVETDVKTAELIIGGKYHKFQSKTKRHLVVMRTLEFSLPKEVEDVLDHISPTTQFPSVEEKNSVIMSHPGPTTRAVEGSITPDVIKSYYNIKSNKVKHLNATQSVVGMLGQNFSPTDLKNFQLMNGLSPDAVDEIVGNNTETVCATNDTNCIEANLDIQYIMSTAQQSTTTFWSISPNQTFIDWILQVSMDPTPPLVHSVSYVGYEMFVDSLEQQRFSQEVAKLAARGVTVVVASGDDGVANMMAKQNTMYCGVYGAYPNNIPYVLSVGGTMGPEYGLKETACQYDKGSVITSGGGFSIYFDRPTYQSTVVNQYLANPNATSTPWFPKSNNFNSFGRAYPDVAFAANRYFMLNNGVGKLVAGTSAAAPVVAGILTLVNSARLVKGKPPVGFVNPALYQLAQTNPEIFRDVVEGDNHCTSSSICCPYGFVCAPGWDPVTGLGSMDVGLLIKAMIRL